MTPHQWQKLLRVLEETINDPLASMFKAVAGKFILAALLQRWMMGTHHGAVQPGQLDNDLNEYVFRFNHRTSKSRGLLFYRLLQQAVVTKLITYQNRPPLFRPKAKPQTVTSRVRTSRTLA